MNHQTIRIAAGQPVATLAAAPATEGPNPGPGAQTPLIDIHEGPDGLVLEADLPGVTEQSLVIQLDDNVLSLQARVEPSTPEGARLIHAEFPAGEYYRSFILSDEVARDQITAELRQGVLCLTLPKAERARTRRIEVKAE